MTSVYSIRFSKLAKLMFLLIFFIQLGCSSSEPVKMVLTNSCCEKQDESLSIQGRIDYEVGGKIVKSEKVSLTYAKITEHNFLPRAQILGVNFFGDEVIVDEHAEFVAFPALEIGWLQSDQIRYHEMQINSKNSAMTCWSFSGRTNALFDNATFDGESCAWLNVKNIPPRAYKKIESVVFVWNLDNDRARLDSVLKDSEHASDLNGRAWFLATFPVKEVRDGKQAVSDATLACEKTDWLNSYYIDTLAAAYAEQGDFDQAVKYASQAIEVIQSNEDDSSSTLGNYRKRLSLFKKKQPYREW